MKKIAFFVLAIAIFFSSCKTTDSVAENAVAQNLSNASEISQTDEGEGNEKISESELEQGFAQNENQAQTSDEIQDEQNFAEKIESDENAQVHEKTEEHDAPDEIEESEIFFAQENSAGEIAQETDSSSNEIPPKENSSEIEIAENFAQDENTLSEKISSEEKNPQEELSAERAPQTEQISSHEGFDESENTVAENGGGDANVSSPREPEFAELNSAETDSDSRTLSITQPEIETRPQPAQTQNSAGANSETQKEISSQRQDYEPRQDQGQNGPTDYFAQNVPQNPASSENSARQNSSDGNPAQISPAGNSARENSKNENSSAESGSEIAAAYDFSDGGENSGEGESDENPRPIPSRSLTLKRNQFVDIIYPGSGWIYLGEEGGDHFTFYGRKQGGGESTFTLRSKKAGNALLHFYKNDALTGKYIDDYIELNVTQETALDASHVEAPSYAQVVPQRYERKNLDDDAEKIPMRGESVARNSENEKNPYNKNESGGTTQEDSGGKNVAENSGDEGARSAAQDATASENIQTVIQTSRTQEESASRTSIAVAQNPPARNEIPGKDSQSAANAASLLEQAQKAYDEKRCADALGLVRKFLEIATENIDAGIFLEGQILEAKSDVRNIKAAISDYDNIVKNWTQSKFWRRANERAIYLKRFYINIR